MLLFFINFATIKSFIMKKIVFLLSIAIITVLSGCQKQTSTGNTGSPSDGQPVSKESPDFVTFADGNFPAGWITYTWEIDSKIGHNDSYSLRSANYPVALVYTKKTMDSCAYVEFYTYGDPVDLFIDGVKVKAISFTTDGSWTKWVYKFEGGEHEFKWQAVGISSYIDDIRFFP